MSQEMKQMIGNAFMEIADAIEFGRFGGKVRVALTTLGSEHGVENLIMGAELAARDADFDIVLIGPKCDSKLETIIVESEEAAHKKMEELLDSGYIQGCVTMHYCFPIGVSTVGRVITPGTGREMFLATTTGTSATDRTVAMVKNTIYGVIAAKAMGIQNPTVGILNVDNARTVERALKTLIANGYDLNFGKSERSDGGNIMRGNDLLTGAVDVMVTDTLTGNILMKMFSSFTTGGSYECQGFGYGPGIGFDYERNILILSRASGVPVVANALKYAAGLAKGNIKEVAKAEFAKVKKAKFDDVLSELLKDLNKSAIQGEQSENISAPPKQVVTASINGIDIMDLEDAVKNLWKNGIYAESGMGCTGPIVLVNDEKVQNAIDVLAKSGYISHEATPC